MVLTEICEQSLQSLIPIEVYETLETLTELENGIVSL